MALPSKSPPPLFAAKIRRLTAIIFPFYGISVCVAAAVAFSIDPPATPRAASPNHPPSPPTTNGEFSRNRRESLAAIAVSSLLGFAFGMMANPTCSSFSFIPSVANAYTPDPDSLRESLYLLCRVQEATCLQERYIQKASPPLKKMKLTLRLVEKSYRLLDQINSVSKFINADDVVAATQVGNEAADALQDAIDFVYGYQKPNKDGDAMTRQQKDFLLAALTETREKLFDFFSYLPDQTKLLEARARVEEENKLNIYEFDPDLANDQGIFNPIELPWKNRRRAS